MGPKRASLINGFLSGTISAVLLLGVVAGPVSAAPPPPSSTATMTVSGCDFTVTYTWQGFKGKNLIATFGLYETIGIGDLSITLTNVGGQLGTGGTLTHTFNLIANAHAARTVVARGALENSRTFTQISGSSSRSTNSIYSTCG